MTAFQTANEAGWLNLGQAQAFDLSWLVRPGTPLSSLLTGVLGIQPYPALDRGHRLAGLPGADGDHRGLARGGAARPSRTRAGRASRAVPAQAEGRSLAQPATAESSALTERP